MIDLAYLLFLLAFLIVTIGYVIVADRL